MKIGLVDSNGKPILLQLDEEEGLNDPIVTHDLQDSRGILTDSTGTVKRVKTKKDKLIPMEGDHSWIRRI